MRSYPKEHPEPSEKLDKKHPAKFPESRVNRGERENDLLTNPTQIETKREMPP